MTDLQSADPAVLLRRLLGGDPTAEAEVMAAAADSSSPGVLVAGAILTGSSDSLPRARSLAATPRDRQLVELARCHLEGPRELFDGLVRDHLATYPDHLLAAWLAARHG